mgnify:CR=1 FL=1
MRTLPDFNAQIPLSPFECIAVEPPNKFISPVPFADMPFPLLLWITQSVRQELLYADLLLYEIIM